LKTLTDNYNVKFEVDDKTLLDLRLTCEFKNQKIDDILNEIEIILPIKIRSDKGLIMIEGR